MIRIPEKVTESALLGPSHARTINDLIEVVKALQPRNTPTVRHDIGPNGVSSRSRRGAGDTSTTSADAVWG